MRPPPSIAERAREADGRAFDLPARPGTPCERDAALLLHGLTGSPFEMRHVAERLNRDGMRCLGPVMPGHGGDPRALAGLPWHAWVEGARRSLFELKDARRTFVVGCSMGALVACVLAHEHPDRVDGMAMLAPALKLAASIRLAGLFAGTRVAAALPPLPKGPSDVRDPEMRRRNPALGGVPLSALAELLALERHVDRILPGVAAPTIVIAGARDHTVALSGVRRLARRIGNGPADVVVLRRSQHLVGIDVERDRCADEVARFFEGVRPFGSPRT